MNILVLLKQVPDTETVIRIKSDASSIETDGVKWIISPYDECAVEEGLRIKEKLKEGTVTALTVGPPRAAEALRTAMAMGADNAIHVKVDDSALDTFVVAKALSEVLKKESPTLVLTGRQAIDDDQAAVFAYVAEWLDMPSISVVTKIDIAPDKKSLRAEREAEGGTKHLLEAPLPVVVSVQKGINTPRYASLPGIMKAKKKPIKEYSLSELGLSTNDSKIRESAFQLPPERKAGRKLSGDTDTQARELVRLLREEAKVI